MIAQEAGQPAREFCPGRRLDAFDQYYSHRQKQKLVQREPHRPPGEPAHPARVGQGLRARRSRPRPHGHGDRGRRPRGAVRALRRAGGATRGAALNLGRVAEVRRGSRTGGSGCASAVLHTAPALGGVSPDRRALHARAGRRGRRGHVALTFDDGPDATSTPQFLDTLADLGWHATFFMLGEMTRRDPGLARAVAEAGHEIAVHGDVHGNMLRRTPRHAADDIARAHETIARGDGRRTPLVPPSVRHLVVRVVARGATARDDDRALDHVGSRLAARGHARLGRRRRHPPLRRRWHRAAPRLRLHVLSRVVVLDARRLAAPRRRVRGARAWWSAPSALMASGAAPPDLHAFAPRHQPARLGPHTIAR